MVLHVATTNKHMQKKRSSRRKPPRSQPGENLSDCPYCGTTKAEKFNLAMFDDLLQSQSELCTALRLTGRLMLQFEKQAGQSLDKIRKVLKRAESVRRTITLLKEPRQITDGRWDSVYQSAEKGSPDNVLSQGAQRKGINKKNRPAAPSLPAVLSFPPA